MKSEFSEYFKSIGIKEPIEKRIETIFQYLERMVPNEEIIDVFVSEYVDGEGKRIYENLHVFFTERKVLVPDFLVSDDFRIGPRGRTHDAMFFLAKEYDFKKATGQSRLNLTIYHSPERGEYVSAAYLKASGENCDRLMEIYHKHLYPQLKIE